MTFKLPPLPYAENALEPHISAKTMGFHHGKHHRGYVDKLNTLVAGTPLAEKSLEDIIQATVDDRSKRGIFNNAAQVWNHTFFWNSMSPDGGGKPDGDLAKRIESEFGGIDKFNEKFKETAVNQFGSGWTWLVTDGTALKIVSTPNAEPPMIGGQHPLLTCDVWEHAYYLDYQNRRADFVETFLAHLVNWDFAAEQLQKHGEAKAGEHRGARAAGGRR